MSKSTEQLIAEFLAAGGKVTELAARVAPSKASIAAKPPIGFTESVWSALSPSRKAWERRRAEGTAPVAKPKSADSPPVGIALADWQSMTAGEKAWERRKENLVAAGKPVPCAKKKTCIPGTENMSAGQKAYLTRLLNKAAKDGVNLDSLVA